MNKVKSVLFLEIKNYFQQLLPINESLNAELIKKFSDEANFGLFISQQGQITPLDNFPIKDIKFHWSFDHNFQDTFYFNIVGTDISRSAYFLLKDKYTQLLGEPDETLDYYGLDEPTWSIHGVTFKLFHIDTHGSGYERAMIEVDKSALIKANK